MTDKPMTGEGVHMVMHWEPTYCLEFWVGKYKFEVPKNPIDRFTVLHRDRGSYELSITPSRKRYLLENKPEYQKWE